MLKRFLLLWFVVAVVLSSAFAENDVNVLVDGSLYRGTLNQFDVHWYSIRLDPLNYAIVTADPGDDDVDVFVLESCKPKQSIEEAHLLHSYEVGADTVLVAGAETGKLSRCVAVVGYSPSATYTLTAEVVRAPDVDAFWSAQVLSHKPASAHRYGAKHSASEPAGKHAEPEEKEGTDWLAVVDTVLEILVGLLS